MTKRCCASCEVVGPTEARGLCKPCYDRHWHARSLDQFPRMHRPGLITPVPSDDVDEVALRRAAAGDRVRLTTVERRHLVATLTANGLSARQIADRIHLARRSVQRHRTAIRQAIA